jgi:uncharacterized membrane protein
LRLFGGAGAVAVGGALDPPRGCGPHRAAKEAMMEGKAKVIFPILMSSVMVFMVTLLVTFLNLGLPTDFLLQWIKAYFIAWPVAATTAYFAMPFARRMTQALVTLIDRPA